MSRVEPIEQRNEICDETRCRLEEASAAFDAKEFDKAKDIYDAFLRDGLYIDWSEFQLGRIAQRRSHHQQAVCHFDRALDACRGSSEWASLERIVSLAALQENEKLAEAVDAVAADHLLGACHISLILSSIHHVYGIKREAVGKIYRRAVDLECADYISRLRVAEEIEQSGDYPLAQAMIASLEPLDPWGRAALGRLDAKLENYAKAGYEFRAAIAMLPHSGIVEQYFYYAILPSKNASDFLRFINLYKENTSEIRVLEWQFHFEVNSQRLPEASITLDRLLRDGGCVPKWPLIQFLYEASSAKYTGASFALNALISQYKLDADALECRVTLAIASRLWDDASALVDLLDEVAPSTKRVLINVKRFEIACYRGDLQSAGKLLLHLNPLPSLSTCYVTSVYRYYAEIGDWGLIIDDFVTRDWTLCNDPGLASVVVRASRRSKARCQVITHLTSKPGWKHSDILTLIVSTLAYEETLSRPAEDTLSPELDVLLTSNSNCASLVRYARSQDMLCLGRQPRWKTALFFCTNSGYLCGTAVALYSLLANNPGISTFLDIFVTLKYDGTLPSKEVLEAIASRFQVNINILDVDDLLLNVRLRESYGLFTGGYKLSVEAYHRIYVAEHIRSLDTFDRAIYLDSDIVVGCSFRNILEHELAPGSCILARKEVDREEVRVACRRNSIESSRYFNSGVLVFDLKAPRLEGCLKEAARLAEEESHRLVFQDQCALNIAFQGVADDLNPTYNHMINPGGRGLNEPLELFGVVHFLDRPKPWDPLNQDTQAMIWMDYWSRIAALLPREVAVRVLLRALT